MSWHTIQWFGGFKIECRECHRYAVGESAKEARNKLRAHLKDYSIPNCVSCTCEMNHHSENDEDLSMRTRLIKAEAEILSLKKAVRFWQDAWHEGRDIIGKLWWHHPAIDNDEQRAYYQEALKKIPQ
jgi:hypothetical protein